MLRCFNGRHTAVPVTLGVQFHTRKQSHRSENFTLGQGLERSADGPSDIEHQGGLGKGAADNKRFPEKMSHVDVELDQPLDAHASFGDGFEREVQFFRPQIDVAGADYTGPTGVHNKGIPFGETIGDGKPDDDTANTRAPVSLSKGIDQRGNRREQIPWHPSCSSVWASAVYLRSTMSRPFTASFSGLRFPLNNVLGGLGVIAFCL